ncbi:hypothetical protein BJ912DRAFT_1053701 [Pholiota molesta]|nr:hypothetical protein BJ912DRAFT_1053701 [Pholiota molesta]
MLASPRSCSLAVVLASRRARWLSSVLAGSPSSSLAVLHARWPSSVLAGRRSSSLAAPSSVLASRLSSSLAIRRPRGPWFLPAGCRSSSLAMFRPRWLSFAARPPCSLHVVVIGHRHRELWEVVNPGTGPHPSLEGRGARRGLAHGGGWGTRASAASREMTAAAMTTPSKLEEAGPGVRANRVRHGNPRAPRSTMLNIVDFSLQPHPRPPPPPSTLRRSSLSTASHGRVPFPSNEGCGPALLPDTAGARTPPMISPRPPSFRRAPFPSNEGCGPPRRFGAAIDGHATTSRPPSTSRPPVDATFIYQLVVVTHWPSLITTGSYPEGV